jgi:hypothetical protein
VTLWQEHPRSRHGALSKSKFRRSSKRDDNGAGNTFSGQRTKNNYDSSSRRTLGLMLPFSLTELEDGWIPTPVCPDNRLGKGKTKSKEHE